MDELQRLHDLDNALVVFNKKLNLNAHLFPINVLEQREIFLAHEGDYDPQFIYDFPTEESLEDIITQLR
jgi:hypothetical protein